ncbi:mammalian cell entry protein [Mycobacterium sp. EPG1]|nr:mammalian cell entry protein [Mycobacterium sp. EPG1]
MSYRLVEDRQAADDQSRFVEAARQGAINLTTIGHTTVEEDIRRILDSSTGAFHDDFAQRSESFAGVVRQAQSTSEGSVTSVALESCHGDTAQVLVVMSVKMFNAGAPEQQDTRVWRMRVGLQRSGDTARISDVEFV